MKIKEKAIILPKQDYQSLQEEILLQYDSLSKRLKQIASFALEHPTEIALDTIAVLSKRAQVQPSALIRFAKEFGYSGFSEMQKAFQSRVLQNSATYQERIRSVIESEDAPKEKLASFLLKQYCEANIVSLEYLQDNIPINDINAAAELIEKAEHIYIIAQRRSFPVAFYLAYTLNQGGFRAHLIDNVGGLLPQQLHLPTEKDVCIAISFPPYSKETSKLAEQCKEKNIPYVAITNSVYSPIAKDANVFIEVNDAEVYSFRSLTATMILAQTLTTYLIFRQESDENTPGD